MIAKILEIVDEAGNTHGPFATREEWVKCLDDLKVGEQRDCDDENSPGWDAQVAGLD